MGQQQTFTDVQPVAQTFTDVAPIDQSSATATPKPDSFWRTVYDRSGIGALQKLTGGLSDWAKGKAEQKQTENLRNVAQGGEGNPIEAYSPRAGYDLLHHTAGLVSSFLEPKNVALAVGTVAANTNPITGIPVDAALVAHGGFGFAKNAKAALAGNPDAVESALLSASEMAGGAAGVRSQVAPAMGIVKSLRGSPAEVGHVTEAPAATPVPAKPGMAEPSAAVSSKPPVPSSIGTFAERLGITDGPPTDLMTRAVKPLSSNSGWDAAVKRALPDMKNAEADLGHSISGVDDALHAASVAKKSLWNQYADKLKAARAFAPNAPSIAAIDGNAIADAMMKSIDKRTALQDPGLVERITKVADTYRRDIPVEEAEDFLQSANNDLHSYYAKNKVGRQIAERDPATGHIVAEADALRENLYAKLDELTGPGASDLKQRYGALSNVEAELLRRKNVAARQQPQSLAEQLSMARAYGKIAVGVARMSPSSLLEGTQSLAASKWLKERGTADAMISRAFARVGQPTQAPTTVPPRSNAASVAAGGSAGLPTGSAEQ